MYFTVSSFTDVCNFFRVIYEVVITTIIIINHELNLKNNIYKERKYLIKNCAYIYRQHIGKSKLVEMLIIKILMLNNIKFFVK